MLHKYVSYVVSLSDRIQEESTFKKRTWVSAVNTGFLADKYSKMPSSFENKVIALFAFISSLAFIKENMAFPLHNHSLLFCKCDNALL